jgi:hypothetical protein
MDDEVRVYGRLFLVLLSALNKIYCVPFLVTNDRIGNAGLFRDDATTVRAILRRSLILFKWYL